jgi:hypothetical protein
MATTIQIPIDLHNPRVTSLAGNSFWTVLGLTAWDAGHWQFVKDVDGKVYGIVRIPVNMAGAPAAKIKLVIAANATSGVTSLAVSHKSVQTKATAESLNPASLTAIATQDITVPATAYNALEVTFTVTETLAAEDELLIEIFHDGDKAQDTLAVNTLLFDAFLEIDVA